MKKQKKGPPKLGLKKTQIVPLEQDRQTKIKGGISINKVCHPSIMTPCIPPLP